MDLTRALRELRAETLTRIDALQDEHARIMDGARDSNADDEHDPEGQTIAWDREQTAALLAEARARVVEIDAAVDRLAAGWDGACEACGRPIPPARLAARPTATRCVRCAGAGAVPGGA